MPNKVLQALSKQKLDTFVSNFTTSSREMFYDEEKGRLRHSGEFGVYREKLCADFLRLFIPSYLNIGNGFLINGNDEVSTQCDLVVYDSQYTPLLEDDNLQRFFPVETVVAIGEVKSVLGKQEFLDALLKLAKAKRIGDTRIGNAGDGRAIVRRAQGISGENIGHHFDKVVSFLICENLSCNLDDITTDISRYYEEHGILPQHWHNLVLSIEDGIFCYKNRLIEREVSWPYPWARGEQMKNRLVFPGDNGRNHFGTFTAYLFQMCSNATIFLPHLDDYDTPQAMGKYQTEK